MKQTSHFYIYTIFFPAAEPVLNECTYDTAAALFYDLTRDYIANNFVIDVYCRCLYILYQIVFSIRSKVISYATKCNLA